MKRIQQHNYDRAMRKHPVLSPLPLLLLLLLLSVCGLKAQPLEAETESGTESVIGPDGYLIDGATAPTGIELQGWSMTVDPDGTPRFLRGDLGTKPEASAQSAAAPPLHPDDIYWSRDFGVAGIVGRINVVVLRGCDDIYIGGSFREIAGVPARNIARWDGRQWHSIGEGTENGTSGTVYALAVEGDDLYVGGRFDSAGSLYVNNLARWDGESWNRIGYGVDAWDEWDIPTPGFVFSLLPLNGDLYVGGRFDSLDTAPGVEEDQIFARNIARWDGQQWHTLGAGLLGDGRGQPTDLGAVYDIAQGFDGLYAGGRFDSSGENVVKGVARWNGAEWLPLGTGLSFTNPSNDTSATRGKVAVYSLQTKGPDVYVGGRFDRAGNQEAGNIALWNSTLGQWFTFGNGSSTNVWSLAVDGRRLYASGNFSALGGGPRTREIAVWEGDGWHRLGPTGEDGTDSTVVSIAAADGDVYIAGPFRTAGTSTAAGLARWSIGRQSWVSLNRQLATSGGVNGDVRAIALTDDFLYVGGQFTTAGFVKTRSLARWSRKTGVWSEFGGGIDVDRSRAPFHEPAVYAIAVDGSNVYIGGRFDIAGGKEAYNVARWNGTEWSGLDEGIGINHEGGAYDSVTAVYALAAQDGILYVGGEFTVAGGSEANRIARWNESTREWSTVGGGLGGAPHGTRVSAIAINGEDLYIGGSFPVAGNESVRNIARFDGTTWHRLGSGISSEVLALTIGPDGTLYAGGGFSSAGGRSIENVAAWDGTEWRGLGRPPNGTVHGLAYGAHGLYAVGNFTTAQSQVVNRIALFDGSTWRQLGSGLQGNAPQGNRNPIVYSVAVDGDDVFAAGIFSIAGGESSLNIAHWMKPGGVAGEDEDNPGRISPTLDSVNLLPEQSATSRLLFE